MSKWFSRTFAILIVIVVAFLVFRAVRQPADPVYQGKRLSAWLRKYSTGGGYDTESMLAAEADDAVRHIGTNAIPVLLSRLETVDSDFELKLLSVAQRQHLVQIDPAPHGGVHTKPQRRLERWAASPVTLFLR